jgi:uncharacterized protein
MYPAPAGRDAYFSEVVPLKRLVRLLVFTLMLMLLLCVGVAGYVGWYFTHPHREALNGNPASVGLIYQAVSITSRRDNLRLSGWFIPARGSNRAVIFSHGYGTNRWGEEAYGAMAALLVRHGFNVLTFDYRDEGQSPGNVVSLGQFEQYDLLGAVDFLKRRIGPSITHIGLLGYSMGASTALLAAADDPRDIRAIVSDSAFADLSAYLRDNLGVWTHLPNFPFTPLILLETPPLTGTDPSSVRPIAAVRTMMHTPVFFIAGTKDSLIPYTNSVSLYQAAANKRSQLWLVPGADHTASHKTAPAAYERQVLAFFQRYL